MSVKNRFVFQPHFTALTVGDGLPNETLQAYFTERAMGGVGLIVDGHMTVMVEGMMAPHYLRAWEERIIPAYRPVADELHSYGTKIFGQLTHAGHTTLTEPPQVLWAPTQMPEPSSRYTTRAMDLADIRKTVVRFGQAAGNLVKAGVDGIEVKIAHDGLLRSFASPFFNQRTDAYGGTFERRMRLPLEVLGSIREAVGPDVPIGVRLCLDEYTPFGYHLDYGLRMAERFEKSELVDYFNCDAGTFSSFWMEIPPAAIEQGYFRPLNRALKKASSLPVVAFGRIKDPEMAERMLELGEADLIGMARPLIADSDIPSKLAEGRADEIRACIGCNDACIHQVMQVKPIRCIQNPAAGQELIYSERLLTRTTEPKSIVVVGGGVAGLKVAEIAVRRGHRVTLDRTIRRAGRPDPSRGPPATPPGDRGGALRIWSRLSNDWAWRSGATPRPTSRGSWTWSPTSSSWPPAHSRTCRSRNEAETPIRTPAPSHGLVASKSPTSFPVSTGTASAPWTRCSGWCRLAWATCPRHRCARTLGSGRDRRVPCRSGS